VRQSDTTNGGGDSFASDALVDAMKVKRRKVRNRGQILQASTVNLLADVRPNTQYVRIASLSDKAL
jgi:hypothetical protein